MKKLFNLINKLKEELLKKKRKRYLVILGILIGFNLLIMGLYVSYGYYYDELSLPIIRAKVGNLYISNYDYSLLIYLEDVDSTGSGNGEYHLSEDIPTYGFNYSGYKCHNGSTLIYDEVTKTTSVSTSQKESCNVYFDIIDPIDIAVKIMIEDDIGSNSYKISENIPIYGYKYSHYECENNSNIQYNSILHSIYVTTSNKEYCSVYFTKENPDVVVNLFVEEEYQNNNYISKTSIPSNILYTINTIKSNCENDNSEMIDNNITYGEGYINLNTNEASVCNIYLDIANE